MVLSGNNTYTGTTTIGSGVLDFVNANSLYNGTAGSWTASNITVSNGATLALGVGGVESFSTNNVATIISNLSGTAGQGFLAGSSIGFDTTAGNFNATNRITDSVNGSLGFWVFGGNTLSVTGANTYTGTTTISAGTLQVGNGGTSGTLGSGNVANNSSLVFNRSDNYGGSISNAISGSGSLTVMGGSLTLSASNSYSGLTKVGAGTLTVNGSIDGAIRVDAAAALKGSGSIAGAATIAGTHGPGNSPGIQSFGSSLTYKSTSTVLLEFTQNNTTGRGTSFDGINVAGDLSFDPGAVMSLTFNGAGSSVNWNDQLWNNYIKTSDGWLLYTVGGSITGLNNLTIAGPFVDSNGLALSSAKPNSYFNLYQVGNNVYLNYAIPEPSTYALFGIGTLALVMAYRRRRA
jgi:fibronectin-binding autotransporter adhesin